MNLTDDLFLLDVVKLATEAHKGQTRWNGDPFILHPLRAAFLVMQDFPNIIVVSATVLHDTVEDTRLTLADIPQGGVQELVDAVTKRDGESKMDAVGRLADNEYALRIKMADRLDNILDSDKTKSNEYKNWNSVQKSSLILLELVKKHKDLTRTVVYDRLCAVYGVER